jgi:hypothetical protein
MATAEPRGPNRPVPRARDALFQRKIAGGATAYSVMVGLVRAIRQANAASTSERQCGRWH